MRQSQTFSTLTTEMTGHLKAESVTISIPSEFQPLLWILVCIGDRSRFWSQLYLDQRRYNCSWCMLTSLQTIHKGLSELRSSGRPSEELRRWEIAGLGWDHPGRWCKIFIRSTFQNSINHFFSLGTSLPYALPFTVSLISCHLKKD